MTTDLFIPSEVNHLAPFVAAGVLGPTELHAAATFARASDGSSPAVILAAALAVRAPLHGHVCVDLDTVRHTVVSSRESAPEISTDDGVSASGDADRPDESAAAASDVHLSDAQVSDAHLTVDSLPWPPAEDWVQLVKDSPLVDVIDGEPPDGSAPTPQRQLAPLVFEGNRLYLARYWALERYLAADLLQRSGASGSDGDGLAAAERVAVEEVERLFAAGPGPADPDQLAAALAGVRHDFVVISGGPGTGKTTTVARFLAGLVSAAESSDRDLRVALVAPTGKAAARMTEAIRQAVTSLEGELAPQNVDALRALEATTIHRLLGRSDGPGFRHRPGNPVPHDVVIVDEASMVSLSLMTHLLAAVRDTAKVVLVGDPHQLASVEAGAVLGDIVGLDAADAADGARPPARMRDAVRVLGTVHRQAEGSAILDLAASIREGDSDAALALLRAERADIRWVDPTDPDQRDGVVEIEQQVTSAATHVVTAASEGRIEDALRAIGEVKVLCALRRGSYGVDGWNQRIEDRLRTRKLIGRDDWYAGRPVMVTENDYLNRVFNGDVGVAIGEGERFEVWFPRAEDDQMVESARLDRIATQWAMSIHKSQGSEFAHVVVTLPEATSRILTRELLYTAVTRAKHKLTIVASSDSVRAAISRPVARASGLAARLDGHPVAMRPR